MRKTIFLCAIAAILGGFISLIWFDRQWELDSRMNAQETESDTVSGPEKQGPASAPLTEKMLEGMTPEERVNVTVYHRMNRGVVNISTKGVQTDRLMMMAVPTEGEGSGSIIDKKGHILTNFHVVDGAREIQVTLFDGRSYPAKLIGIDPDTDMAVLKIDAPVESLYPVPFGNSAHLLVGQRVLAIGNPFGLERTLSTGIISSLDRSLPARKTQRTIKSVIQIDAAINPGNSGGPLLDSQGRMIGMNTAIASKTGDSAGVGFAIPVNTIARIVPQLIENGHIRRPEAGIAQILQTDRGLLLVTLIPGGPAEKAGLRGPKIEEREKRDGPFVYKYRTKNLSAADVIAAIDGKPVRTGDDLLTLIENKKPGDRVTLTILRGGKQMQVPLELVAGE